MKPILVTGTGVVSAIGLGKAQTLDALLNGRSGVGELKYLKTGHKEFPVGEVKLTDAEMRAQLGIPKFAITTRTALMGMLALKEALQDTGLTPEMLPKVGFISGTTVGGMDMSEQYYLDYIHSEAHKEYISAHDCGSCTEMTANHFGKFAFVTTLSTACSSAANAIILGANMIRCGEADIVVVGGSECITKFHLNGFNSLMILDTNPCRPFDATRNGLNLGEGAAYLVLETEESAQRRGVKAQALLSGYGNACDAFHQTASSPEGEGAYRAMKEALELAGIQSSEIDYINAHGTGTPNNDASESQAMKRLFGDQVPPVSSTKPFTGHTTSASGSIEAVFCVLALQNGFLPVNLNWSQAMEDGIVPVSQPTKKELKHILCNAFGFGGNDSSLLLSSVKVPELVEGPTLNDGASTGSATCYILSAKQISIQQPLSEEWMQAPIHYDVPFTRSIDPSYKDYVSPIEARRMGKILKRAVATSKEALSSSGLAAVDAIITGTGYGCIENTEFFLDALSNEGEQLLKPTYFMQSTHNTISSLVAIQTKNHGYNVTYAHKSISFDSALQDAWWQFKLGKINSALVGGHDEMTETFYHILKKGGVMGHDEERCGEAAVSVVLSRKLVSQVIEPVEMPSRDQSALRQAQGPQPLCKLTGFTMLHQPTMNVLTDAVANMLQSAGKRFVDVDFIFTGISGNRENDKAYLEETKMLFGDKPLLHYKHLFGESFTASGLGFYVAAQCLKTGRVPASLFVKTSEISDKQPKCILLYNRSDGKNVSLTLLEA
ncbi:MAG: beta-ketoacyl-[acyl-carrier-protein] synthase family protein [Bacteroidales bacterium]|nr:beta-ketoacyl-[acyl-carrier-protein] synthase family protein [Bacteroidales bacterium]